MGGFLSKVFSRLGSYEAPAHLTSALNNIDAIQAQQKKHNNYVSYLLEELHNRTELMVGVINALPDWAWHKDKDGFYVYVNDPIRNELFCGLPADQVVGHNDVQIATKLKSIYGDENHTFGQLCANSDDIILNSHKPYKFYEIGLVDGRMLRVIVNKNIIKDAAGKVLGTVGTGRNVTEDYDTLIEISNDADEHTRERVISYLEKYKFDDDKPMTCKRGSDKECTTFPTCGKPERCKLEGI